MSLHDDLLEQADHLARRERRRPKQASLRRAVSTAYYSLFHLLVEKASSMLVRGKENRILRDLVRRAFDHREMVTISRAFGQANLPAQIQSIAGARIDVNLQFVADAFVDLQEARHRADYDLGFRLTRNDAMAYVSQARLAIGRWSSVQSSQQGYLYLAALLLHKKWNR
ncbi:MAG: hypothetical protein NTX50_30495 [Candidatus Sumerlaeota bacterium]|nr:hypothetical protein [Candidatus Sumerlaeota bacterium]